jgi:hypothetical protein
MENFIVVGLGWVGLGRLLGLWRNEDCGTMISVVGMYTFACRAEIFCHESAREATPANPELF